MLGSRGRNIHKVWAEENLKPWGWNEINPENLDWDKSWSVCKRQAKSMFILEKVAPSRKETGFLESAQRCPVGQKSDLPPPTTHREMARIMEPREFDLRGKERRYYPPWVWDSSTAKSIGWKTVPSKAGVSWSSSRHLCEDCSCSKMCMALNQDSKNSDDNCTIMNDIYVILSIY